MPTQSNTSTKAVMEPRIRVRRAQVRHQEGRRRLRVLVAVLICVTIGAGAWVATRSPLLDVDHIFVVGASQTGPAAAVKAAGVRRGSAMTDLDEGSVARRLRGLPWVRSASVRREWPGTVRIGIVERVPLAMTPNTDGGWALVDIGGRVLSWMSAPASDVLAIAGVPPAGLPGTTLAVEARGLLDVAQALPGELRPLITNAHLDPSGISLGLVPQGTIVLGDPDDLVAKLRVARLVLEGVDTVDLDVLDVRLPATPTLTRVQP